MQEGNEKCIENAIRKRRSLGIIRRILNRNHFCLSLHLLHHFMTVTDVAVRNSSALGPYCDFKLERVKVKGRVVPVLI